MSGTGYIINGKYVKSTDSNGANVRRQPLHREFENETARQVFAKDIIQPYLPNGKPNPEFIDAYPEQAEQYGFVKKEDRNI